MKNTITDKQKSYICYLLHLCECRDKILDHLPRNSEKYPDTRANYRWRILEDRLDVLDRFRASYFIKILSAPDSELQATKVELFLKQHNII